MDKNIINHNTTDKITGFLLINLGTPDKASFFAIQRYLQEFLNDRRVIEIPRLLWWLILYCFVLPLRPFKLVKKYQAIWLPEGAPLLVYSKKLVAALQAKLSHHPVQIQLAMRYGNPSVKSALTEFKNKNIRKLIVLPLYPQYSAATTASAFDAVSEALKSWRLIPELEFKSGYADYPPYITAIADSIRQHWKQHSRSEKLLISFHGLPKRNLALGDPYYCWCHKTARLIAEGLQLTDDQWLMVFQSRFGKAEWLQPYCDKTLQELAEQGIKTVDVVCPGFAADCLETLEEISQTYAEQFEAAGGTKLNYIPALNADHLHVTMLEQLIKEHL